MQAIGFDWCGILGIPSATHDAEITRRGQLCLAQHSGHAQGADWLRKMQKISDLCLSRIVKTFWTSYRSGTDMTGRPGYRTMEMIGGSSAPYLARTPCVPLFCTSFNRVGNKERFRQPGAGGGSFPLYGGTFARSYSVSNRAFPAGPNPLDPTPSPRTGLGTDFDLILTRFGPEKADFGSESGQDQV